MIITRLIGGLGNQLFQYAAGFSLGKKNQVPFLIDISEFSHYKLHAFHLHFFKTSALIATQKELDYFKNKNNKHKLYNESTYIYEPQFMALPDDILINGYWQSEQYFKVYEQDIRKEFSFIIPLFGKNLEISKLIQSNNAVSMHIRRGDYVANKALHTIFHQLKPAYYEDAAQIIASKISNPHFFIFSDDPEWTKENIHLPYAHTYITHNTPATDFEDMRLMSLCQHNIMANSSFSWWGAWLNTNPEKIVIAPKNWFCDGRDTTGQTPKTWMTL